MKYTQQELKALSDQVIQFLRPATNPVVLKYCRTEAETRAIPNVEFHTTPASYVCGTIGIATYLPKTLAVRGEDCGFPYCAICNGLKPRDEKWDEGQYMMNFPTVWFGSPEDSKKHTQAQAECRPDGYYAIVASPMAKGDILDPDVVCISLQPGAAFYLFSGLLHKDYRKLNFPFIGESSCADTWNRTFLTGEPGLSLGCRGDRGTSGLAADEVRVSLTVEDLKRCVEGMSHLTEETISYPFYPVNTYPKTLPRTK